MPAWNELINALDDLPPKKIQGWINRKLDLSLKKVSDLRGGRNVIFYTSAFLQKPDVPAHYTMLVAEEMNGFMSVLKGMDWDAGLTLVLHTPGGEINAAESIVSYLRSKFDYIEVIVPTFAMSAGTMISLAADRIIMGRQSQLGPIDPQMNVGTRSVSARALVDQFDQARKEILENKNVAHAWAPVLQSFGPALLIEAQNALDYSERMVAKWLEEYMFSSHERPAETARATAKYFGDAKTHKSHGRRIDRDEARTFGVIVDDLEDDDELQEHVLTAYHVGSITFERSITTKMLRTHHKRSWIKNYQPAVAQVVHPR